MSYFKTIINDEEFRVLMTFYYSNIYLTCQFLFQLDKSMKSTRVTFTTFPKSKTKTLYLAAAAYDRNLIIWKIKNNDTSFHTKTSKNVYASFLFDAVIDSIAIMSTLLIVVTNNGLLYAIAYWQVENFHHKKSPIPIYECDEFTRQIKLKAYRPTTGICLTHCEKFVEIVLISNTSELRIVAFKYTDGFDPESISYNLDFDIYDTQRIENGRLCMVGLRKHKTLYSFGEEESMICWTSTKMRVLDFSQSSYVLLRNPDGATSVINLHKPKSGWSYSYSQPIDDEITAGIVLRDKLCIFLSITKNNCSVMSWQRLLEEPWIREDFNWKVKHCKAKDKEVTELPISRRIPERWSNHNDHLNDNNIDNNVKNNNDDESDNISAEVDSMPGDEKKSEKKEVTPNDEDYRHHLGLYGHFSVAIAQFPEGIIMFDIEKKGTRQRLRECLNQNIKHVDDYTDIEESKRKNARGRKPCDEAARKNIDDEVNCETDEDVVY